MVKYLLWIVLLSGIFFTACGDDSMMEDEDRMSNTVESNEALEASKASHIKMLAIPGSAHAQALFKEEEKSKIVMEAMIKFINE